MAESSVNRLYDPVTDTFVYELASSVTTDTQTGIRYGSNTSVSTATIAFPAMQQMLSSSFTTPFAITANGQTGFVNNSSGANQNLYKYGVLVANVSAVSGTTPTIGFYLDCQDALSNTVAYNPSSSNGITSALITATGVYFGAYGPGISSTAISAPLLQKMRVRWVVSGTTPSFTVALTLTLMY